MRYLVAPDSFKGSLPADRVADIVADEIRKIDFAAEIDLFPLADGGEGTVDLFLRCGAASSRNAVVHDAAGQPVSATWCIDPEGNAIAESASCLGLNISSTESCHPFKRSSRGLGELVRSITDSECRHLYIGLGGTSVVDAGYGLAREIGYSFSYRGADRTKTERETYLPALLEDIESIRFSGHTCVPVTVLADVRNPLLGSSGALAVFGPQKGMKPEEIVHLERAFEHYSAVVNRDVQPFDTAFPGSGAAGGLGFALAAFCNAHIVNGIEWVLERFDFARRCRAADIVLTGEGKIDDQTGGGKAVSGVAAAASKNRTPVLAFTGRVDGDAEQLSRQLSLDSIIEVSPREEELQLSIRNAEFNLRRVIRESKGTISRLCSMNR